RVARLLEPVVQPACRRERGQEARRRREAGARRAARHRGRGPGGEGTGEGLTVPARPRLLVPGLVPRDPARERHRVRRGAATAILLEPDDRLTVRDLDGGQRAEVTVVGFGTDGFDGLGVTADGDATILRSLVGSGEDGAAAVVTA